MMTEHQEAVLIAERWLDFKMDSLADMVPGDPDCAACVLARSYLRLRNVLEQIRYVEGVNPRVYQMARAAMK